MAMVSRTDKLEGARAVLSGGVELAIAADASLDRAERRYNAFFGVVSIVMGIGQRRGIRALAWGGAVATGAWWTWEWREARRAPRVRPAPRENPGLSRRDERAALRARLSQEFAAPLTRRDRLTSGRRIASGVISFAIAADGSLKPHQRATTAVNGALAIAGGVGRLRRSERVHLTVMGGYVVLLPVTIAGAILRQLRRR